MGNQMIKRELHPIHNWYPPIITFDRGKRGIAGTIVSLMVDESLLDGTYSTSSSKLDGVITTQSDIRPWYSIRKPSWPVAGSIYMGTDMNTLYQYNGSTWEEMKKAAMTIHPEHNISIPTKQGQPLKVKQDGEEYTIGRGDSPWTAKVNKSELRDLATALNTLADLADKTVS